MRAPSFIPKLVAASATLLFLFSALAVRSAGTGSAAARAADKQGKGADSPSVWTRETSIVRPASPGQPRGRQRIIRAPLLTFEFSFLKRGEDDKPIETNPNAVFFTGDRFRLRFKPNQDGYLTIIEHTEGKDGEIIFPDTRINEGKNFVKKNEEIIVPSNCEEIRKDNCWWIVAPPAGREVFTIIFSREASPEVLENINPVGATVKLSEISKIRESPSKKTSKPNLSPEKGGGAGRYVIWVTNEDRKNNEELIARIVLNHQERSDSR
ncbi:MAG TPA: DUF4384 domain-containing protein [Blastocatellia bacterium]|nr:DUF4384 domain-containing protein [Blastocatellia bacterium]